MPFTNNHGTRIYWRLEGHADLPPLVLLHSISTDMGIYNRTAPFLEERFRLLRIDSRGHGASDAPATEYSIAMLAEDVIAVMEELEIESAIVCGTSLGAMIAMQMGISSPNNVAGLILANTTARMDPALWIERIEQVGKDGVASIAEGWVTRHFSPGFMSTNRTQTDTVYHNMTHMESAGYIGTAAAIRDMDLLADLPRIDTPTLVIAGEEDAATPFDMFGRHIVDAIPGAQAAFLPTGHLACIEQPEEFARCVFALADRCDLKRKT